MSYVIAIDVGIKNLGLCVFDFRTARIVEWKNVSLVPDGGRYIPAQNVQYVRNFVRRFDTYFNNAFQIVVERQIRCNMRIVEAVLQTLFFDQCVVISARSVKMHYDLSTRNYRANKQKAVQWAKQFVTVNGSAFARDIALPFNAAAKQDDLADSLLLLMYFLDTYSNQFTSELLFDDVRLVS